MRCLFNGGALTAAADPRPPVRAAGELERRSPRRRCSRARSLDLAVSRGAAYYGLVRRGLGVRIGWRQRARLLPRPRRPRATRHRPTVDAALPGAARHARGRRRSRSRRPEFTRARQPAGELPAATRRARASATRPAPSVQRRARLAQRAAARSAPCCASARSSPRRRCRCTSDRQTHRGRHARSLVPLADHRPSLAAAVQPARRRRPPATKSRRRRVGAASWRVSRRAAERAANDALRAVFPADGGARRRPASTLMRGPRSGARCRQGRLAAGRDPRAVETLFAGQAARGTSQAHEARWLNLCGFLLRPGFGHALDDWRIQQLWKLYSQGLRFPRATQCRVEWWGCGSASPAASAAPQQTGALQPDGAVSAAAPARRAEGSAARCRSAGGARVLAAAGELRAASRRRPRPSSARRCCRWS